MFGRVQQFFGLAQNDQASLVQPSNSQVSISDRHHSNGRHPTSGTEDSLVTSSYQGQTFIKADCSSLSIEESTITRQSNYPTASGGLGDVYKCTWNCDTGSDEIAVKSPRFGDLSTAEATKINKACRHGLNLPYA
ncbi:hypothetical protein AZE42_11015 [Rhizopogon vesiculosus]|uniref:Protein kinase domain-containing protein n=1 Tax=Rhizopogon vesiculosus TaxID=180088 RepID=A0A1J8QAF9_9AGAM|nr:hypothetical protein AZE42_11015 [Rhizopogon vesiculosus]